MNNQNTPKLRQTQGTKLSKREFLKTSLCGFGLFTINSYFYPVISFAESKNMSDDLKELIKHSKEAMYYSSAEDNTTLCSLCPNACKLSPNDRSICKNKFNINGKMYTIAYGNPCSVHTDPIEKKPLYHFYPSTNIYSIATAGCNFSCLNCQNWTISQVGPEATTNYDLKPADVINTCLTNSINAIAYTYSEPIAFYEYMYDTAKLAKSNGIKNVLVSNGYINKKPLEDLSLYIDAANINLKSFDNTIYKSLNGGSLEPVKNTLLTLKENNVWLEITNLIVPGYTDSFTMITEMCNWLSENGFSETPLHFSRFSPMYKLNNVPLTPVSTLEKARKIAIESGIKYVYIGNVPGTEYEDTFCYSCNKKVVNRKGFAIIENQIINGKCNFCNTKIAGKWE